MAESVKAYLRCDPALGPSPAEDWVKTYEVGKDVKWADGKLRVYRPPLGREETR